jgi:bifunctional DNA-binding transcriptional regulator/antitoxin component of YhaV-PrlF toxin-antitoxin module
MPRRSNFGELGPDEVESGEGLLELEEVLKPIGQRVQIDRVTAELTHTLLVPVRRHRHEVGCAADIDASGIGVRDRQGPGFARQRGSFDHWWTARQACRTTCKSGTIPLAHGPVGPILKVVRCFMNLVTVDSKRRVTLPKEMDIKPGQVLGVEIRGDHAEFYPVQIVPMEEFKKVMASVSEEHKAAFERLAK